MAAGDPREAEEVEGWPEEAEVRHRQAVEVGRHQAAGVEELGRAEGARSAALGLGPAAVPEVMQGVSSRLVAAAAVRERVSLGTATCA
jgi:hypothetical protein